MIYEYSDGLSFHVDGDPAGLFQQLHQRCYVVVAVDVAAEAHVFRSLVGVDHVHVVPASKGFHDVFQPLVPEVDLPVYPRGVERSVNVANLDPVAVPGDGGLLGRLEDYGLTFFRPYLYRDQYL